MFEKFVFVFVSFIFFIRAHGAGGFFCVIGILAERKIGCDKTTPAQLMGGISANKPILHLVTGPMMPGNHRGVRVGACTDCRNNWASYRAGTIDIEEIGMINEELAPTVGFPRMTWFDLLTLVFY